MTKSASIPKEIEDFRLKGVADFSFGVGGVATFPNTDPTKTSEIRAVITFANGESYGHMNYKTAGNVYRSAIVKFDSDTGQPDTSFGTAGVVDIPAVAALANEESWSYKAEGFNDRYILMCGYEYSAAAYHASVKVFDTQTESLVPTFGTAGTYFHNSADGARPHTIAEVCAWDKYSNQIVFAGRGFAGFNTSKTYIGVLDMTGTLVASFNTGSILQVTDAALVDSYLPENVLITSDSYTFNGTHWPAGYAYDQSYLHKISKTGVADPAFGTNGFIFSTAATAGNGLVTNFRNLYLAGDGNLISQTTNYDYNDSRIVKLSHTSGAPVLSFGTAGVLEVRSQLEPEFGPFTYFYINNLILMGNGHLLVNWGSDDSISGFYSNRITEFDASGAIVRSFGVNGTYSFVIPTGLPNNSSWRFPETANAPILIPGICYSVWAVKTACVWKVE